VTHPTLEHVKTRLAELGFTGLRLEKSWKQRTHREALIMGRLDVGPKTTIAVRRQAVLSRLDTVREELGLHYEDAVNRRQPFSHVRGDAHVVLEITVDVALPDHDGPSIPAPARHIDARPTLREVGMTPRGLDAAIAERARADGLSAGRAELLSQEAWSEYAD
jgi:hypothetical protein